MNTQYNISTKLYEEQQKAAEQLHDLKNKTPDCKCTIVPINQGTKDFEVQSWTENCPVHGRI
jgi:hypothetical protein